MTTATLIPVTVTLSISPAVYRPAEVTGELVRKALEQHKKRNARMATYMREWRSGARRMGKTKKPNGGTK